MKSALPLLFAAASLAYGATVHDESVNGDLSSSSSSPTILSFATGSNVVTGSLNRASSTVPQDRDYFTFTIPANNFLFAINVLAGTNGGGTGLSFMGLQGGSTVIDPSTTPNSTLAAALLGYTLYSSADIGGSILNRLATSNGSNPPAQGFSRLGPGTYSVWIQETATGGFNYSFDFVLATPEPSTWAMALAGAGLLAFARGRRKLFGR